MQNNNLNRNDFFWKQLENNISVTHFPSTATMEDSSTGGQIYVKKYEALKIDQKKKIPVDQNN